jgi:hypothetical protein
MSKSQSGCSLKIYSEHGFGAVIYDDFKTISAFIKTMKSLSVAGQIRSGKTVVRVKLCANKNTDGKNEPYVIIESCVCNHTRVNFNSDGIYVCGYQENNYSSLPIMFFTSTKMYYQFCNRWIPANLKTFGYVASIVRSSLMRYLAQNNPMWKDFMRYEKLPAVSLELIGDSRNIKDLLERKFKTSLPNSVNGKPLDVMYAACCAMKYVPDEQRSILFATQICGATISKYPKETAKAYLNQVVIERLNITDDSNIREIIIDYIAMAFMAKEKVNLLLGKKGYSRLHDEYQVRHRLKQSKVKLKFPDTELSKIVLPDDFKRIETNKDLVAESARNNNCVWSYIDKINEGKCLIYTLDYNNEHCTIEIGFSRSKYCVKQLRKSCNREVSPRTGEYVKNAVKTANINKKGANNGKYQNT